MKLNEQEEGMSVQDQLDREWDWQEEQAEKQCPVTGAYCEDYKDCKARNYCHLK